MNSNFLNNKFLEFLVRIVIILYLIIYSNYYDNIYNFHNFDCYKMSISSNVIDIDNIIKVKEKELQQIQQIRNGQLEQLLKEREQTISMITQKYDLLKDDFQYNLQLIEARDKEINRLETMIHQLHDEQQQFEQQIDELKALVDNLHEQERTQKTKYDQERLMHKVNYRFFYIFNK